MSSNWAERRRELRRGGSGGSRSPRRRGVEAQPTGGADSDDYDAAQGPMASAMGAVGGPMMGMQRMMRMQQQMMRQMAMNPMAQQAMMQQQLMMQQMMTAQMGTMQQLMLGQQQAFLNSMRMSNVGRGGAGVAALGTGDPEETQRQMGRQAYENAVAAMHRRELGDDEEDDEDVRSGPSSSVHHPNYRPVDGEIVPGLTDKRFEGRLKLWFEDKGYGFIECDEIRKKFRDVDVFLHQNQKRHFRRGAWISFAVFMNFRKTPQATELRKAKEPAASAG
mmetsp:Transcript_66980/g.185503  ORF Transcript_66980/g.185503 Transcript_66980/m.185503 type:complete len:277 (+) Transcript_66980:184-1014(+)